MKKTHHPEQDPPLSASNSEPNSSQSEGPEGSPPSSPAPSHTPSQKGDPRGDLASLSALSSTDPTENNATPPESSDGSRNIVVQGSSSAHSWLATLVLGFGICVFILLVLGVVAFAVFPPSSGSAFFNRFMPFLSQPTSSSSTQSPAQTRPDSGTWTNTGENDQVSREDRGFIQRPLVSAEQVLADAETMRGELYGRGLISVGGVEVAAADALATLDQHRTSLVVALFAQPLTAERTAELLNTPPSSIEQLFGGENPALLVLHAELSPFGSDCSPLSIKRYRWIVGIPGSTQVIEIARNPNTADLSEFKEIGCVRRTGELFTLKAEGSARAMLPSESGKKLNKAVSRISWSVAVRKELGLAKPPARGVK